MHTDDVEPHFTDIDSTAANSAALLGESFRCYRSLIASRETSASFDSRMELTLGGQLLYAGELGLHGRAMVIAGNVAGCATLAVAEDPIMQKRLIRDSVVDFVVTSLDEALRILKNEIRKQTAVAVCVGALAADVEREMEERGVLPDLAYASMTNAERGRPRSGYRWREIRCSEPDSTLTFVVWQVAQAPARWMTRLDEIALNCLASDRSAQRWLRVAPRYSGREAQAQRALYCNSEAAKGIIEGFAQSVRNRNIGTEVTATLTAGGETEAFRMSPLAND